MTDEYKCKIGLDAIKMGAMMADVKHTREMLSDLKDTTEKFIVINNESHKAIINHQEKQNNRIGKLENWKNWVMGGIAIIAIAIVVVLKFID